jgi:hypothetical protein
MTFHGLNPDVVVSSLSDPKIISQHPIRRLRRRVAQSQIPWVCGVWEAKRVYLDNKNHNPTRQSSGESRVNGTDTRLF